MMTESEINCHGYHIDIEYRHYFMPFCNMIEYASVYLIHPNGKREYIDYTGGGNIANTSWIRDKAIRRAQEHIKKGGVA